jgi:hypothetical protein
LEQLLVKDITLKHDTKKGRFTLTFNGHTFQQNVCEFLQTFSFLVGKDIEEYLLNTDSRYDTVRIPLTGSGQCVTLSLADFITFREAYSRQMFLLKLEDMLLRQRIRMSRFSLD